jgi:hypothetical protein
VLIILGKRKEENELSEEYDTEELLEFQGTLVDLVIFENSLWWQRQGVFLVFNSIFAAVLWSLFHGISLQQCCRLSSLSFVCLSLCFGSQQFRRQVNGGISMFH